LGIGSAVIGALRVDLSLGTAGWEEGIKKVQGQALGLKSGFQKIGGDITKAGAVMTAGITLPFVALIKTAIPAAQQAQEAIGQVRAALEHMGDSSGRSEQQLQAQARALMALSKFDDDEILRKVTANLLTFGNVSGKVFDEAQLAIVNLSARMGTDLQAATIMIGKALNDPAKGLAALRRVGIQFTEQQQKQIKAMAAAGNTAGAQAIMLKELERQFGGSAKAMRDATPGADLKNSWDDFTETVGGLAIKVLPPLTSGLAGLLEKFNALPAPMQQTLVLAAAIGAALGPILLGLGPLVSLIGSAIPMFVGMATGIGTAATAAGGFLPLLVPLLPVIAGIAAAAGAAYLVWKNWATIGPMIEGFGKAVVDALGPSVLNLINAVKDAFLELWNSGLGKAVTQAASDIMAFGKIVLEAMGASLPGALRAVAALFRMVFDGLAEMIRLVVSLLEGDWAGAWSHAKNLVQIFKDGVTGIFRGVWDSISGYIIQLVTGIDQWMGGKLSAIWDRVKEKIDAVKGYFRGLWDAVIGHSYIPDMVDGIAAQMGRLDAVLAQPVERATGKAASAFKGLSSEAAKHAAKMSASAAEAANKTAEAFRNMLSELQPLLDQLFPDERKWLDFRKNLALLNRGAAAGVISGDVRDTAAMLLINQANGAPEISQDLKDAGKPLDEVKGSIEDVIKKLPDLAQKSKETTAQMIEAFAGMARDVLGSLRGMVSAFKGGDILGGLSQLLDIVVQVAGLFKSGGIFGGRPSVNVTGGTSYGGGRALGGPVIPGRSYRVGERGKPEWFVPGERGRIVPGEGMGGGNVFNIQGNLLTPEFWDEIQRRADEARLGGTLGGAALAMDRSQRRAHRNLYGGG
jgi:phage-related protein/uncharacterized membrane protein